MMILCQGAPFDIATTSGIAQSVVLRFVDSDGTAKDISGNTFRCAVRGPGAAAIKCDPIDATSARLAWSPLKAGAHAYDLFMAAPDGAERPLIMGEIQAAPRVTPPGNEDVVTIGEIEIIVPDAADGEVKIIDPAADAAERAESAAQKAESAGTNAETARKDAEAALKLANDAAAAAQKVLAAMPQVDDAGNMTLGGGLTVAGAINANGGINSPSPIANMQSMTTLGAGYAAEAFNLSGHVDLRGVEFANAVNVSKLHYPYLMDKDTVIFHETVTGNNFLSYPVIIFNRYELAWGTFPSSSIVLSMGGTYVNFEAGEHNAFMGLAFGQNSLAAQRIAEVTPPYIYLKMHSLNREETTFSVYYNIGDGERVFTQAGLTRSINRLFLICEWVDTTSMRVSVGVVYGTSNLGVTNRQVTIYQMGMIAVDYYAVGEKVIPFFSNNTTITSIPTMRRALGLSIHPGMLITDYFSKVI